jgi:hypothetical protein
VPRAPRLTGREHNFSLTYPGGRQLRGKTPVLFVCSFFFHLFSLSLFLRRCCFCSGPMHTHPTLRCHDCLLQTAYHRSGRAPFGWFGVMCTSRNLSFVLFCCFAPALRAGQHAISLSRVSGSRGGGAEGHTYSPHDARDVEIRALKFGQRTSFPLALFIHSACQLPKEWLRNMTTRCCCLFPKMK